MRYDQVSKTWINGTNIGSLCVKTPGPTTTQVSIPTWKVSPCTVVQWARHIKLVHGTMEPPNTNKAFDINGIEVLVETLTHLVGTDWDSNREVVQ